MKRSILLVTIVLVICTCVALTLFGCKKNCTHEWQNTALSSDPTCTLPGSQEQECTKCGATQVIEIPALGHDSDGVIAHEDATCTDSGVVGGSYCSRCNEGKEAAEATIDALGHNSKGSVEHKDATCLDSGVVGGTYCSRCNEGKEEAEATIDALGHHLVLDTDQGVNGYTWADDYSSCIAYGKCDSNGCEHSVTVNANIERGVTQNKSCILPELTKYTASFTDAIWATTQTKENVQTDFATGHSYGNVVYSWNDDKTEFYATRTCPNCEDSTQDHSQKATSTWSCPYAGTTTCTEDGTFDYLVEFEEEWAKTEKVYIPVPALGHNSDGTIAHKDPTCVDTGIVGGTYCTRCNNGKEAAEAIIPALGHSYGDLVNKQEPTCEEKGHEGYYQCSVCNKYFDSQKAETTWEELEIIALGHNSDGTIAHKDPTCVDTGIVGGTYCTRCNYGKEESEATIDALGHNYGDLVNKKDPTCEDKGYEAYYQCSVCKKYFDSQKAETTWEELEIIALGHNSDGTIAHKDATCIDTGIVGGTYCTRCDNGKEQAEATIDALGHNSDGKITHVDATCIDSGVVGGTYCTRCNNGKEQAEATIDALGHDFDSAWSYDNNGHWHACKNTGCTEKSGYAEHTFVDASCSCGASETVGTNGIVYTFDDENQYYSVTGYNGKDTDVVIAGSYNNYKVVSIANSAFSGNKSITSVKLPSSLKYIGASAFWSCPKLTSVTGGNVIKIENVAFYSCTSLKEIEITSELTTLGMSAFQGCTSLTSFKVPKDSKLSGMDYSVFQECTALTDVYLGDNLESINDYTFKGCTSLTNITIGKKVWRIGYGTFQGCTSLKNVTFAADGVLDTIAQYAFDSCTALTEMQFPATVNLIDERAFNSCTGLTNVTFADTCELVTIGLYAFCGCQSLTSITLPDSIYNIGAYAFYMCTNLESVTFGASSPIVSIGKYAFYQCTSLKTFVCPDKLATIENGAFYGCVSLMSVTLSSTVTTIGNQAFSDCIRLFEIINNSSIELTIGSTDNGKIAYYAFVIVTDDSGTKICTDSNGYVYIVGESESQFVNYVGNERDIVFPDTLGGKKYSIPYSAFKENKNITSITISSGITSIGDYAFYECTNLSSVTFAENSSLKTIGRYAFGHLSKSGATTNSISSLVFPESLVSIGDYAFYRCKNLSSVVFAENGKLESIGESAFEVVYNDYESALSYINLLVIPDSVTTIGQEAFRYCTGLISVTIGKNVTSIGHFAFANCNMLYEVVNNSKLSFTIKGQDNGYIGYYATVISSGTSNIITDENGVMYIEGESDVTILGYTGSSPEVIISSTISDKDYLIYKKAFYKNNNITSLVLSSKVVEIGENAFGYCYNLANVTIPNDSELTTISTCAFDHCTSLTSINIPKSVTKIGDYSFRGCTSLNSLTFANDISASIGHGAFSECTSLVSVVIPSGITSMGNAVFSECTSLESVTFDGISQITSIGNGAFRESIITSFDIPESVTTIGNNAFKECKKLTSIVIPSGVTSIGNDAFNGCTKLETVEFGEDSQLVTIGSYAFLDCKMLTSISIPSGVTSLGAYAFQNCTKLATVDIDKNTQITTIGSLTFQNCTSLTSIVIPDSVTSIGGQAFYNCSSLTSVNIPDGVTTIGTNAFYGCSKLTSIVIPKGVTSIGNNAFNGCTKLSTIDIDKDTQITSIGNSVFYNCRSLTSIVIPDSVTSIGDSAFYGCSKLTSISIPEGITSIAENAFNNCDRLFEVINNSSLSITVGSTDNGRVAYYALYVVTDGSGTKIKTDENGYVYIDNEELTENVLIGYVGSETALVLPTTLGGKNYSIAKKAFYENKTIESIVISSCVTSIGDSAFYYCTGLKTITIEENSILEKIGKSAFYYCTSVTSIVIPDSVTSIGGTYAFSGWKSTQKIYFVASKAEVDATIGTSWKGSSCKASVYYSYTQK